MSKGKDGTVELRNKHLHPLNQYLKDWKEAMTYEDIQIFIITLHKLRRVLMQRKPEYSDKVRPNQTKPHHTQTTLKL